MYPTKISSQGQLTLPKHLRANLGISANTTVILDFNPRLREVTIKRAESIDEATKRISSYIKQGTTPIKDVRTWLDQNWEVA